MFECNTPGLSETQCFFINAGLYLGYILLFITAVSAIVLPVFYLIKNPTNIKSMLIGIGSLSLIFVISYILASDEVLDSYGSVSSTVSKFTDVGLISLYCLFVISIISILFAEVSKIFHK